MPSSRATRSLIAVAGALALACSAATSASADDTVTPADGNVVVTGHGWGHGRGMSQYGAYGAARKGLQVDEILGFYYPGTTLGVVPNSTLRVLISSDSDGKLHFRRASGLVVSDSSGKTVKLSSSKKYTKWRISRSGSTRVLSYRNSKGKYVKYANPLGATLAWSVKNTRTGSVKLSMPDGSTRTYPGTLALNFSGSQSITVNNVPLETYLRSVVPAEMPASWGSANNGGIEAVKAQSVAARTYAVRTRTNKAVGSAYDICDTSSCQVYKPLSSREPISDAAIKATAGKVVLHEGRPAFTEFTSSNGGWTAGGDYPYLQARRDPYDPAKLWTTTISAADLQAAYPTIGTFTAIQVSERTGVGPYDKAGRATQVVVTGTAGSVTVTGASFKRKFSLKETLFAFSGAQAPNPAAVKKKG